MSDRPPGWAMKQAAARKRWQAVRNAAASGDPVAMETAVSKFEPIAEYAIERWCETAHEMEG